MPTYDYECSKCGYKFEKFQNMNAKPLTECPKCKKSLKRLIGSGAGIIFKGAGFYATDYKKSSSRPKEKNSEPVCPIKKTCNSTSCPQK